MSRNYDEIRGNLAERFDAVGVINQRDFYACTWAWVSYNQPGQVWVSGPIYTKGGATHQRQTDEKLVSLKDLSHANAIAIHDALQEHWHDAITDLQVCSKYWQTYFNFECEGAASEKLRQRVAGMAEKFGGAS